MGRGLRFTLLGLALGCIGALAMSHVMSGLLFGVTSLDVPTCLGTVILLIAATLCACYAAARRATHVDPIVAIRYE
jgi:ABC-type antimicrobial peptide transport system permease subunit